MDNHHLNLYCKFSAVAKAVPNAECMVQGRRRFSYAEVDRRTDALANLLLAHGIQRGDRVSVMERNSPEHMECYLAAGKIAAIPCNVNYKYKGDELRYLLRDSGSHTLFIHADFLPVLDEIRHEIDTLKLVVVIGEGAETSANQLGYEAALAEQLGQPLHFDWRGPDNDDIQWLLYTGGTTGYPKGVMWDRQFWEYGHLLNTAGFAALLPKMKDAPREFFAPASGERTTIVHRFLQSGLNRWLLGQQWVQDFLLKRITATALRESAGSLDELATAARKSIAANKQARSMIACPLMHGTGYLSAIMTLTKGGALLFAESKNFSPKEIWEIIERERATSLSIVGDTFAAPLAAELEAKRYDTSALRSIVSSGVIFSAIHKRGLLKFNPQLVIMDSLGASEGLSRAEPTLASDSGEAVRSMNFQLAPHMKVFDEQDNEVVPGSDTIGQLAVSGAIPRGYWGDPEKTAKTFRVIRGVRYSIFGDFCKLREDGTLILLGRGTHCINTGGEKVYPEEVEKVLKDLPEVEDCCVLGVPDERWGQAINAMVSFKPGQQLSEQRLIEHCEQKLSNYKKPKKVWIVGEIPRRENGKMDYPQVKLLLSELTGVKLTA
ncbi:MAG TPA: AMP-binding protein [Pseudomonadales bacterium]|nr:AMP-binding protein [Pseudomonadales bacterium]